MMPTTSAGTESRSIFHISNSPADNLNQDIRDCYQGIEEFRSAMKNMDGAGTHLTESLAQVLRGTRYQSMGDQLAGGFREVYGSQGSQRFLEQLQDMETMLLGSELPRDGGQEEMRMLYAQVSRTLQCKYLYFKFEGGRGKQVSVSWLFPIFAKLVLRTYVWVVAFDFIV